MTTGEELGYQDGLRQVQRSLHRRCKQLEEARADATPDDEKELEIRMDEIKRFMKVIESLHR